MNIAPHNRILVIDDNRSIHEDFRKILGPSTASAIDEAEASFFGETSRKPEQPVFDIDSAFQGEEAIAMIQRARDEGRPYAVAFIDVRMPPGIDGIETTAELWKICPELQVVICTAYSDYSWQAMIARVGRSDNLLVLKKPFAAVEVVQLACSLTEKWRLTEQARHRLAETERIVEERTCELRESNQRLEAEMLQRQRAEEQLLRAQRLESIGMLAGGIAHDLNNVLAPIIMAAPMLREKLSPEKFEKTLSTIEVSAGRAASVVHQLLTFARGVEAQRVALRPVDLLAEMEKIALETFPRSIRIESRKPDELWLAHADPTQLHQVLMNLCLNARDAMPEGGTLTMEADNFEADESYVNSMPGARVGRYVVLRVSDTGSGIPRQILDRIFDPFFTTKPLGKGTGLGLSTVVGIIKSHDGFLDVRSEQGKGSTFEIFLPTSAATAPAAIFPHAIPPAHRGELVLVVDDESAIRELVEVVLNENGYRTLCAVDGADGIAVYKHHSHEIRAVLTDLMMPVSDGMALCRELRGMDLDLPIIASSGNQEEAQAGELHSLNVHRLLRKPYQSRELLAMLHEALS